MARKYIQGIYEVKNPQKYAGHGRPKYRSGWEQAFMRFCDTNDYILQWASESISIPYRNPITGKNTHYIPDFLIMYQNKSGQTIAELIEIKPKNQSILEGKMSPRQRAVVAVNYAKWDAAHKWAKRNGLVFRVITEDQIFHQGSK
jgi:TnsA endonuclease N terminal